MPVGRFPLGRASVATLTALAVMLVLQLLNPPVGHAHPGTLARDGCHKDRKTGERHCHPERANSKQSRGKLEIEGTWTGRVVWVADADSLRAEIKGSVMEIRLADIDAPERPPSPDSVDLSLTGRGDMNPMPGRPPWS